MYIYIYIMYPPIYYTVFVDISPKVKHQILPICWAHWIIGAPFATVTYRVKNIPTSLWCHWNDGYSRCNCNSPKSGLYSGSDFFQLTEVQPVSHLPTFVDRSRASPRAFEIDEHVRGVALPLSGVSVWCWLVVFWGFFINPSQGGW